MTLDEFQRVVNFLRGQGIEPTLDMLRLEAQEWNLLLDLTIQWEKTKEKIYQPTFTEEELEEEKEKERLEILYHSAG
jgi:hypothetical protein